MKENIFGLNNQLNAFITLDTKAFEKAGKSGELCGVAVAVKDNICTRDLPTTCASKMLEDFCSCYDAYAVDKLRREGAVIIGKTNMDEFGMGSTGENSSFGKTINPINPEFVPGGSSSGSAVAVKSGMADMALGSDTGGSVRMPASNCGIVGFKPSYGAVSRNGLIAFASSFDQIGILSKTVSDAKKLAKVIYGKDPDDFTSKDIAISDVRVPQRIRIGISSEFNAKAEKCVLEAIDRAVKAFEKTNAQIISVSAPMSEYLIPVYYILSSAEASSNLSRFDGIKYGVMPERAGNITELISDARTNGFGKEVKRRILMGTFVLSAGYYDKYYHKAECLRGKIKDTYTEILENECDIFLSPVSKKGPAKTGEFSENCIDMYNGDFYTVLANLTGMPAISIPAGEDENGMPIGVQLMSGYGKDSLLLAVAEELEKQLKGGDAV